VSRNPYEPPKAPIASREAEGLSGDAPDVGELLCSPAQLAVAGFIGGPAAAGWLAMSNYSAIGLPDDGRSVFSWSLVAVLVVVGIAMLLPDGFPNIVMPVVYAITIRHVADQRFGAMVKAHRAAGGELISWWKVVGVALLVALIVFAVAYIAIWILSQFGIAGL